MINKFVVSTCADILKEVFIGKNPADVHLSYFFKKIEILVVMIDQILLKYFMVS